MFVGLLISLQNFWLTKLEEKRKMANDIGKVVRDTYYPFEGGGDVLTSSGDRVEYITTVGSVSYRR